MCNYFVVFSIGFFIGAWSNHPRALQASYDAGVWIRHLFTGGA